MWKQDFQDITATMAPVAKTRVTLQKFPIPKVLSPSTMSAFSMSPWHRVCPLSAPTSGTLFATMVTCHDNRKEKCVTFLPLQGGLGSNARGTAVTVPNNTHAVKCA